MHLRKFDLNLLVVFDVVMKERSIVGASERLSLSQSAVSFLPIVACKACKNSMICGLLIDPLNSRK